MNRFFTLLFLGVSFIVNAQDPTKTLQQAEKLFEQGRYADAEKKFAKVVERAPSATGYLYLGLCQYLVEDYPEALNSFNQVLETHAVGEIRRYALKHKAYSFFEMDSLLLAKEALEKLAFEFALDAGDLYHLSFIHTRLNEPHTSMEYIQQCVKKDTARAMGALMMYHLFNENWKESLLVLDSMTVLDPQFSLPMNYAYCHSMLGNYAKADSVFQTMENKKDPQFMNNYGFNLYFLGDQKTGMQLLNKAREKMPENSYVLRNLAFIAKHEGRDEMACEWLQKALELGYSTQYGLDVQRWQTEWCKP